MIDLQNAKNEFEKYVNKFDFNDENILRKKFHSFRVMDISKIIAQSLNLSESEVTLAALIGLLHDIGRFEQREKYKTFKDKISTDHGELGEKILRKENYIKYYDDNERDIEIICTAIRNHNKYKIENNLSDTDKMFINIIRDADKLDIFYEAVNMFWNNEKVEMENSIVTPEIVEKISQSKNIERNINYNQYCDNMITIISFIYDINYKKSFQILKSEDYINKMINRFNFKNHETKEILKNIENMSNKYIEQKAKG